MHRILIVEDHKEIADGIAYALEQEGYTTDACTGVLQAYEMIESALFDLAILDIRLEKGTEGYEICKRLKEAQPDCGVIFLTAMEEERNVVQGLDTGADDYIVKPFRMRELLSRIRAVLRRYRKGEEEIICGDVRIDLKSKRVFVRHGDTEQEAVLTAAEYKLLYYLFCNRGRTLTRETLLTYMWDYAGDVVNDNTLTVCIKRLREKIGEKAVTTVRGTGYRADG